ncbi:MAG: adenylate/guanylate cyclase domain-containing protein, partial [Candidatus Cloacimonadota bacterium]|nr:adenylate/guanylate cyclase domain-containing protein [Candidatus Cloacimonadota bacterium]
YLWIKFRTIGELFLSLLIFFVSFLIGILINIFLEEKDKRIIKGMFGKYLSPELIEQLIKDPSKLKLGGEEKNISVLFTDIYNFTDLSENTSPIQIVDNLNGYLKGITGFVIANKGYLDKFTGDGIMALFGAPEPYDNHAFWACKTAIKYKNFYTSFSKNDLSIASNRFHTQTRIAIHSGKTVSGNIGSSAKMNYTAIGDTVNLSARLEAINKIYQTNIIVSQDTYELVKTDFLFRELDTIKVKGRESATTIYELIDFYEEKPVWIASYEKGLDEYRNKRWEKAANIFQQLIKSHNDPPSKELLKRCHKLIKNNPQNWNSTFKLYTK